jgi:uncharacterized protein YgiB involved in biofilm formation
MPAFGKRTPAREPEPGAPRFSKRSQTVSLVLLVGAGAAAWGLSRVDPSQREEDALVYPTEEGCTAGHVRSVEECRDAFREARDLYPRIAPRYATSAECEAHHGASGCLAGGSLSPEAAGWFVPVMAGVMMGRTLAQGLPVQPLFPHRPEDERQAASGGSAGGYCTSSGGRVWASSGGSGTTARVSSAVARNRDSAARVVRGGLGSTGRSFAAVSSSGHASGHASSGG